MDAGGVRLSDVRAENRRAVLGLLVTGGPQSRKSISDKLGLTPAAITKICRELIRDGKITELGEEPFPGKSGRRERILALDAKDKHIMCINAENDRITFSVTLPDGTLIKTEASDFEPSVDKVIAAARRFIENSGCSAGSFIGACVCTVGSADGGRFGKWREHGLAEKFAGSLGMPVVCENNVKAFAEAQQLYGSIAGYSRAIILKWGPGIGSTAISGGRLLPKNENVLAEIGHYIAVPDGKPCRCGRRGCLETVASSGAISAMLGTNRPLSEIISEGEPSAMEMLGSMTDRIALALMNTATILDSDRIILFGSVFDSEEPADLLRKGCMKYNPFITEETITVSDLNDKRAYIGATATAAVRFFFE